MEQDEMEKKINKIYNLLFGNPDNSDEISFVSKVNLMYKELNNFKHWLWSSVITFLAVCLFIGGKLYMLDNLTNENSANLKKNDVILQKLDKIENEINK